MAPLFVQFSLIYRRTLRKPAPLQLFPVGKRAPPIREGSAVPDSFRRPM
jgi:hypothetical protein